MKNRNPRHVCLLAIYAFIVNANTGTCLKFGEWTAHIPDGYEAALDVASRHGISFRGDISIGHAQSHLFSLSSDTDDEKSHREITRRLLSDPLVDWVSRQYILSRERKSVLPFKFDGTSENRAKSRVKRHHLDVNCLCKNVTAFSDETVKYYYHQLMMAEYKLSLPYVLSKFVNPIIHFPKDYGLKKSTPLVSFGDHVYEVMNRQSDPSLVTMFNDPKWPCQWELYNCGQTAGPHRVDLNVVPCWEKGFTGEGVVITIVDDGLDYINKDLKQAFNPRASADLNDNRDNDGPLPNKNARGNDHGTKCGGEISMRPNNNYCGVGVAYGATLGGIRFLDGVVTDTSEAAALVFNADYIDIYSCSWGPQDNGRTWEGPGRLASAALEVGANEGRGGLGSIYVWAAGNGGASGDDCGADGYTCSIYTIGIASVSDQGLSTFYTESCSCIMAVTLNGGSHHMPQEIIKYQPSHYLVTTDPYEGCVNTFSGTSSAAPLASGVLALVLQANPKLTWRDAQHVIAQTSKIPNPEEDGWAINGAGFHVHHKYGFGLLDAAKMVMTAQTWKNVPKQQRCEVKFPNSRRFVSSGGYMSYRGHTNACSNSENRVWKLEHVQVIMSYSPKCRGDVSVDVISPCGTRSQLMATRELDNSRDPVTEWPFMSVHNWGEDPRGVWTVKISDKKGTVFSCHRGNLEEIGIFVKEIRLVFWGTEQNDKMVKGCQSKKKMADEVLENNITSDTLKLDRKDPIDIDERINQEIINEEFVGEEDAVVDADDLKSADKMPSQDTRQATNVVSKTGKQRSAPTNAEVSDLRRRLIAFLTEGDNEKGEFSKDEVPLSRNTRTLGR